MVKMRDFARLLRPAGAGIAIYYVHTDQLNTPRRVTRPADNAIVWRWDSDPFGEAPANTDPDGDSVQFEYNLRFPGQYYDAETGLHYNYFRDYDPAIGRYVESDPIGLRGGINTYQYANANPVKFLDPAGLDPWAGASAGGRLDMLIGGFGVRTGFLTNPKTGETCALTFRCLNIGVGVLAAFGAEASISFVGPRCGRDLDGLGLSLTLDAVAPGAPGFGGSIDVSGGGVGVGIGPTGGAGIFGGVSLCYAQVIGCKNTPCECQK